jgi:hypothetical protein
MLHLVYTDLALRLQAQVPPTAIAPTQGGALGLYIDLYNNQLADPESLPPYLPAVFIEFSEVQWTRLRTGVKTGKCILRIHIGQANYADAAYTPDGLPMPSQATALQVLQFVADINAALELHHTLLFTKLVHENTITDHDHDYIYHHIQEYSTTLIDDPSLNAPPQTAQITDINQTHNPIPTPAPQPTPYIL